MIKFFLVSAIFALVQGLSELPPDMKEMAQGLHNSCAAESGVDQALIKPCENGHFDSDQKLKCYFKCIFTNTGAITPDNKLDVDSFIAILPDSLAAYKKSAVACKSIKGSDGCDLAMKFNMCIQKTDPSSFFVI